MIRTLDDSAYVYCFKVCKEVLASYSNPTKRDYPSMVVACSLKGNSFIDRSGEIIQYCKLMDDRFLCKHHVRSWNLSMVTNINRWKVGNCAEEHVANKALETVTGCNDRDIDNIIFSHAIRPRTKNTRHYCDNCLLTFPQLSNEGVIELFDE